MNSSRSHPPAPLGTKVGWIAIIPVKSLVRAKTRLADSIPGVPLDDLALAIASDTVRASCATPGVHAVLVVTDDDRVAATMSGVGATIVAERSSLRLVSPGFARLNEAVQTGEQAARQLQPDSHLVTLTGDLPALRPDELDSVLTEAWRHPRGFLADAGHTGTAALTAGPGHRLQPRFGVGSARAHAASGAYDLQVAAPSVRRDVDTIDDLRIAIELGLGPRTSELLSRFPLVPDDDSDASTRRDHLLRPDGSPLTHECRHC